ncbi:DUF547 domain-containing protein [Subsaximicrobium wynnwilliamsii]|uniref:DUF547 domain-containing protein n=1 Tax=Subsaximicrobium wynnwilliamsii TaxID=291179 RepID=A0A5C6ZI98_9FLAO|nr:DUF547 domain-containing protein [Subsaximicrobium wynnwilliamsii]TXD83521.1 DUF547 domain-containing protein [Subsaximicrobium wynnwilliamsii]TXD89204.1 DUF547 domain-containing protein [Subsaximicrobium wynnwilliamsii]TXE03201.1 DUF547 domain-containing protein [Subsaximicrobium wynnwilliamsii]
MKTLITYVAIFSMAICTTSCNLLTAAGMSSQGQPTKKVQGDLSSSTLNSAVNVDHSAFDKLLKKHVNNKGFVDYKGFSNDQAQLEAYLKMLSELDPSDAWSVQELLAYYINLYNAATVQLILENYPTKSIQDIDKAFIKAFVKIGDSELSLGGIENGVLRKMNEPRIHFAINCAAYSCPKLMNEAYTSAKINEQLEAATVEFINSDKNDITKTNPKLSKIFDFYTSDFKVDGKKDLIGFVNQYSKTKIDTSTEYTFKDYDWSLNEQRD